MIKNGSKGGQQRGDSIEGPRMRLLKRVNGIEKMEEQERVLGREFGNRKPGRVLNPFERLRLNSVEKEINKLFGVLAIENETLKTDAGYFWSLAVLAVETLSFNSLDARAFEEVGSILKGGKPSETREGWIALLLAKVVKQEFLAPDVLEEVRKSAWDNVFPRGERAKALYFALGANKNPRAWKGVVKVFYKNEERDIRAQGIFDVLKKEFLQPDVLCNAVKITEKAEAKEVERPPLRLISGGLSQKRR